MEQAQIRQFLEKFAQDIHTEEEHEDFIAWLKTADYNEVEAVAEEYKNLAEAKPLNGKPNAELIAQIEAALDQWDLGKKETKIFNISRVWKMVPPSSRKYSGLWRTLAAAAILGFVIWSVVFVLRQAQDDSLRQAQGDPSINSGHDVKAPEVNRAMVTLSDGRRVYLDSALNGSLAIQHGVELVKNADGIISYQLAAVSRQNGEVVYNTLTNPRGSKVIDMTLSDGSRVWLNAGSSVTYPVVFVSNERKVTMDGEAYFEIAHDKNKPFKVGKGDVEITVLGTHFNVNAYEDERDLKVTLLEGMVNVKHESSIVKLAPRQSAFVKTTAEDAIQVHSNVNVEEVMAWKNGVFYFDGADLQMIMRQIGRWYDVDVVYQGKVPTEKFKGEISRNVPASKVLQMLEYLEVRFRIEGKKVVVL